MLKDDMSQIDLRPLLGRAAERKSDKRFLLVCFFDPAGIATIYENIALWQRLSRHPIEVLNLWPGRGANLTIPATVDLREYAGIIIHCTASYDPSNLNSLDARMARPLEEFDGIKILMKQDENFHTLEFPIYIGRKRVDLVITCVSPTEREKVYPQEIVGDAEFLHAFTGYVSPFMRGLNYRASTARVLDIAYRGSLQPLSFGRLGFEKRQIGYDIARVASDFSLKVDISSRWEDRIGGLAWFEFLGRSHAVLGSESGTNLFDFTGEVDAWCVEFIRQHPGCDHASERFYRKAHVSNLHKFEDNVQYGQVSPRHFEAAATWTVQILYEGAYSGVLVPNRHFLPLRRDLSNLAHIVDFVRDAERTYEMAECTFEEVVQNPEYHYESFVARFDDVIDRLLAKKGLGTRSLAVARPTNARRALVLVSNDPTHDPRIDWLANGLSDEFGVCELGIRAAGSSLPGYERLSERRARVRVTGGRDNWDVLLPLLKMSRGGARELMMLHLLKNLHPMALGRTIGAIDATADDLARFRSLARHFLDTNSALIRAGEFIGYFDLVVAADLDTLPAAVALADQYGAAVLYDAHEYWPLQWLDFRHWEVEFWSQLERDLAQRADLRVAVSPQLAEIMSSEYGCEFHCVPNCAPKSAGENFDLEAALRRRAARARAEFLFLGGFAPGRGIEDLIGAWSHVGSGALLLLQGPDSPFKTEMVELARRLGLLNNGVSFPPPVETSELIDAAQKADVGVIPYASSSLNNRYCSPNKLSQYMAAGLPIICNDTEFVKGIILDNDLGICADFHDHLDLARVVDRLATSRDTRNAMARRAHRFFNGRFNWEAVSNELYAQVAEVVRRQPVRQRPDLNFRWLEEAAEADDVGALFSDTEVTRLTAEIARLDSIYTAEIARLNSAYTAEINHLNSMPVYRLLAHRAKRRLGIDPAVSARRFRERAKARIRSLLGGM